MRIYLAGERSSIATTAAIRELGGDNAAALWVKGVKRRLFSYYYHGYAGVGFQRDPETGISVAIIDAQRLGWDLFLDSGAFTARKKNVHIPTWAFGEYVNLTEGLWDAVSSLDTIGSGERAARASYEAFVELRALGAQVQPVWHVREPEPWLQKYLDEGYKYVFIGGMVGESIPWLKWRLDAIWSGYLTDRDGTPKVDVHGFGLTNIELLFRYPWYSVDSTSWLKNGIDGSCLLRDPATDKLRKYFFDEESWNKQKWPHYRGLEPSGQQLIDELLEAHGVTAEQLGQHYSYRDVVNAAVFQSLEDLSVNRFVRADANK
jgi:hypothetical protein